MNTLTHIILFIIILLIYLHLYYYTTINPDGTILNVPSVVIKPEFHNICELKQPFTFPFPLQLDELKSNNIQWTDYFNNNTHLNNIIHTPLLLDDDIDTTLKQVNAYNEYYIVASGTVTFVIINPSSFKDIYSWNNNKELHTNDLFKTQIQYSLITLEKGECVCLPAFYWYFYTTNNNAVKSLNTDEFQVNDNNDNNDNNNNSTTLIYKLEHHNQLSLLYNCYMSYYTSMVTFLKVTGIKLITKLT